MLTNDRSEFLAAVNRHREAKDKQPLSLPGAQEWWEVCKDLPLSDCLTALRKHSKSSNWVAGPSNVYKLVTGSEEGGQIAQSIACQYIDNGTACTERWAIQRDGKAFCSRHYDTIHGIKPTEPPQFRWQDLIGAYRGLDKIGELRTRQTFGNDLVDYVIDNSAYVHSLLPDPSKAPSKAPTKPLPIPQRAA